GWGGRAGREAPAGAALVGGLGVRLHRRIGPGMNGVCYLVNHTACKPAPGMVRGIGVWQATALNVTLIVGAGVFATIPAMVGLLPGPYALLAWAGAGLLLILDGLVWSELGAAMPRSGGSYHFLPRWVLFIASS